MLLIFELYTLLCTLPRKKFDVNITSLIMVYKTVHQAQETVDLLDARVHTTSWTQNSPDLYPLDYSICQVIQGRVYQQKADNVDEPKQQTVQ